MTAGHRGLPKKKISNRAGGDGETGRRGDGETGRRGDGEMGRRGDGETGRRGDGETGEEKSAHHVGQ